MSTPAATSHPPHTGGAPDVASLKRGLRTAGVLFLAVGILLLVGFSLQVWNWFGGNSAAYPPQNGGVAVANCNGTIQTVRLSSGSAQLVNPGGQCLFTFEVTEGTVRFGNNAGEVAEWSEGQAAGGRMRGVVTKAEAVTSVATLNYMLCPLNRQVVGWQCL